MLNDNFKKIDTLDYGQLFSAAHRALANDFHQSAKPATLTHLVKTTLSRATTRLLSATKRGIAPKSDTPGYYEVLQKFDRIWRLWRQSSVPFGRQRRVNQPGVAPQLWGYGRVSSAEQAASPHALEQQLARLAAAGIPRERLLDDVGSGVTAARTQYRQLVALVQAGQVNGIVATRWDRLLPDGGDYQSFQALVQRHGVTVQLLDQGTVTGSAPPHWLHRALKHGRRHDDG